jgi:hypothetical protein
MSAGKSLLVTFEIAGRLRIAGKTDEFTAWGVWV